MNIEWSKEVDVLVVGYGLAGAVASIEAHDVGARVLILEKGQYPGGCSILGAGMILCAVDLEEATKYLSETSGGRVDSEVIIAFAQELVNIEGYLSKLAQVNDAKVIAVGKPGTAVHLKHARGYAFPGRDTFYAARVAEVPGFNGFPWIQRDKPSGPNLMKVAFDNVDARHIDVLLSAPAKRLVTDDQRAIIGVIAEVEEEEIAIRTHRAVVLACGGFEHNQWLQMQYLQGKPFYSMAPLTHTGDGIIMAQEVGAALWHMWHIHGSYGFKFPEFPIAFRHVFSGTRNPKRLMAWIVVDKFGRRYMNEYPPAPQDTGHRPCRPSAIMGHK